MRPLWSLAIFFAVVFLGAALLAPWIYYLAGWIATLLPSLDSVARNPFHRYVNRCLLALALVSLWPLLRSMGMRSWADVGLGRAPRSWRLVSKGFSLGFASLACVALIAIAFGARHVRPDRAWTDIVGHLFQISLTAIVVAGWEEVFFRGALFGVLRKALTWSAALWVSSSIYALLHFFEPSPATEPVTWASGLTTLVKMMRGFGDLEKLAPGFLNLTLAGAILALAYQRSGSVYFSIGLHAGWVFWVKSYGYMTKQAGPINAWFWGSSRLIDGWLCFVILLAMFVLFARTKMLATESQISQDRAKEEADGVAGK